MILVAAIVFSFAALTRSHGALKAVAGNICFVCFAYTNFTYGIFLFYLLEDVLYFVAWEVCWQIWDIAIWDCSRVFADRTCNIIGSFDTPLSCGSQYLLDAWTTKAVNTWKNSRFTTFIWLKTNITCHNSLRSSYTDELAMFWKNNDNCF